MNPTVAYLTANSLLGKRRALLLLLLPALLVTMAVVIRITAGSSLVMSKNLLESLAMSPMVPLLGLIIGTGVIAAEVDDGSILYMLAKPVSRARIVLTKLAVAVACVFAFIAVPTLLAGMIVAGFREGVTTGFFVGSFLGGIVYSALFLFLGVISRHATVIGLIYALVWESLVGAYVPGAQVISIQQWALAISSEVAVQGEISSAVGTVAGLVLLAAVAAAATAMATVRLRSLTLVAAD